MAAFVGFDPVKTHKPQIVRVVSAFAAVVGSALVFAFSRLSA